MRSIPPEILTDILSLASIDAGQATGCSLNLVCKAFREICVVSGIDIYHASVRGAKRLDIFLGMLEKRKDSGKMIRSLMLADDSVPNDTGVYDIICQPFNSSDLRVLLVP